MKIGPNSDQQRPRQDVHLDLAGRIMQAAGIEQRDHVILQENVAVCLKQLKKPALRAIEQAPDPLLALDNIKNNWGRVVEIGFMSRRLPERWSSKILRDLEKPYDDHEVFQHLRTLDKQLQAQFVDGALKRLGSYPRSSFAVSGGLARGRFGANSDVDLINTAKSIGSLGADSPLQVTNLRDYGALYPIARFWFKPRLPLDPQQVISKGRALEDLYRQVMHKKGYSIEDTLGGGVRVYPSSTTVTRPSEGNMVAYLFGLTAT